MATFLSPMPAPRSWLRARVPTVHSADPSRTGTQAFVVVGIVACVAATLLPVARALAQPAPSCSVIGAGNPVDCPATAPAAITQPGPGSGAGNPIDVIGGNKYQLETDLPPLPGALGLEIRRHYNSSDASSRSLGPGWRLGYEAALADRGKTLDLVQADGRRIAMQCKTAAPRICTAASPAHGVVHIVAADSTLRYRWRWPDGRELEFGAVAGGAPVLLRIRASDGATLAIDHDAGGRVVRVRDPRGRALHLSYEPGSGRTRQLVRILSPVGQWSYRHDAHGRLAAVTGPPEPTAIDEAGRPLPAGATRQVERLYHYRSAHPDAPLTGISVAVHFRDAANRYVSPPRDAAPALRVATYDYDASGRAVGSAGFDGADRVRLAFLPGEHTRLTNADGAATLYRHAVIAGERRIVESIGPGCARCPPGNRRFQYDPQGALRSVTVLAADGSARPVTTTRARLDKLGRTQRIERRDHDEPSVRHWHTLLRVGYHASSRLPAWISRPSVVAGREHRVDLSFNESGQLRQVTETGHAPGPGLATLRRSLHLTHDGARRLTAIDGPLPGAQDTVRYSYDGSDRVIRITGPGAETREIGYDPAGRISRLLPADRVAIEILWTATGAVREVRRAGRTTTLRHDALGRTREVLRDGVPERLLVHDPAGRLRFEANADFTVTRYDHDSAGRVLAQAVGTHRSDVSQRLDYDDAGRLLGHVAADGGTTTLGYDWRGFAATLRDPAGILAAIGHDERGRPRMRVESANTTAPAALSMAYDALGHLNALTDTRGRTYRSLRDDFGRIVATSHPDAGTSRMRYDEADRLLERVDADGAVHRHRYDDAGRLLERISSTPGDTPRRVALRYRGTRLVSIENDAQAEERSFDDQGRVVAITRRFHAPSAVTATESFSYRADGALAAHTLVDGSVLRARRNAAGRITALDWIETPDTPAVPIIAGIEHDGRGLSAWTYGNGVRFRAGRDGTKRLTMLDHHSPSGVPLLTLALRYDARGNVAVEQRNGEPATTHLYDVHNRLVASRSPGLTHRYAYNGNGDRVAALEPSQSGALSAPGVAPDATALAAPTAIGLDAVGRVVSDTAHDYRWNAAGRLSEVRAKHDDQARAPLARYAYNARGERVAAWGRDAGQPTYFVYHGGRVSAEIDATGQLRRHYIYLDGTPVATIDRIPPGTRDPDGRPRTRALIHFLHTNHLRTPELATDGAGRPVWIGAYRPFGAARNERPLAPVAYRQPLAFAGQYRDEATGLHYNLQRYYDPRSGRYLSPDPLGPSASLNAYAYVDSNPRSAIDPLGLILFAFDGTGNTPESRTNVSWLAEHYRDNDLGIAGAARPFYESGPGSAWWAAGDAALAYTLSSTLTRQLTRLDDYLLATLARAGGLTSASSAGLHTVIDVVGFSRGAAAARSFANIVAARAQNGHYLRLLNGRCVDVQLRFMGLFDTVLSVATGSFDLGIPAALAHASQAVALNEHRTLFPLESIEPDFTAIGAAPSRVELGFVGSHSDVGGGYACADRCDGGDLSDVALNWMVAQARRAGVTLAALPPALRAVSTPLLHNEIHGLPFSAWGADQDRAVRYPNASNAPALAPAQRVAPIAGLDTAASLAFINPAPDPARVLEGSVDLAAYRAWLAATYGLVLGP